MRSIFLTFISPLVLLLTPSVSNSLLESTEVIQDSLSKRSVVSLGFLDGRVHCYGTIISKNKILTDAGCLEGTNGSGVVSVHYLFGDQMQKTYRFSRVSFNLSPQLTNTPNKNPWQNFGLLKFKESVLPSAEYMPMKAVTPEIIKELGGDLGLKTYMLGEYVSRLGYHTESLRLGALETEAAGFSADGRGVLFESSHVGVCDHDRGAPLVVIYNRDLYFMGVFSGDINNSERFKVRGARELYRCGKEAFYSVISEDITRVLFDVDDFSGEVLLTDTDQGSGHNEPLVEPPATAGVLTGVSTEEITVENLPSLDGASETLASNPVSDAVVSEPAKEGDGNKPEPFTEDVQTPAEKEAKALLLQGKELEAQGMFAD